jgi:glycosyltransferase involved in cell wall biosynthesis
VRIVLVGTELAPVRLGAGALETLLWGWAATLQTAHDVHVVSVADGDGGDEGVAEPGFWRHDLDGPHGLAGLVARLAPDAVVLNNRPGWQPLVAAATLHLFHNWPDAWGVAAGRARVGRAGAAAVSGALARTVAGALGRSPGDVAVVVPPAGAAFAAVTARPEPGLVLAPNRLLAKKGVRELVAAAERPALDGHRILVTDYLSPWRHPTAEHRELRALVAASSRCELVGPPPSRGGVARLYATAAAVVVPSVRPEGLGMTAVEAQAAGVPVVTSGLGGLAEVTSPPGRTVDVTDPDALADAVAGVAASGPGERAALRAETRRRFSGPASLASLLAALERARPPA